MRSHYERHHKASQGYPGSDCFDRILCDCVIDAFLEDEKTQDAIMYNLIVMGGSANKISDDYQEKHPEIPWSSIIGTRNVIVHGYDQVKLQIVWDIINKNLQSLKESLKQLV